ncbi:rhodanese-like domain-containing protein [Desulfomicrobium salsuginis]
MPSTPASTEDILAATQSGRQTVLDVLPPEHFEARHIPGARNACVYEVTFLDQAAALAPDKTAPIIVYGAGEGSLDAVTAAGKLHRAGYVNVSVLHGGFPAWQAAGHPLEGTRADEHDSAHPVLELRKARYVAVPTESTLIWTGRNAGGRHTGTLAMREGTLIREGEGFKGIFTLAMDSIANTDLAGTDLQPVLENHLKSDDFFFVSHFPTCTVEITDMTPVPDAPATLPNFRATAVMTLRGVAREIAFDAHVCPLAEGRLALMAHLDLDRTIWGALYGSARFFKYLSYHVVHDMISVDLRVVLE